MGNAASLLAYNDIREVLEKALQASRGLTVELKTSKEAVRWVSRANSFRLLDRKANMKLYQEGHTMHGASAFDVLMIAREGHIITITTRTTEGIEVKEL